MKESHGVSSLVQLDNRLMTQLTNMQMQLNTDQHEPFMWVFPKIGVPQNGWFIMENLIKMDDLGGTTIFGNIHVLPIASQESALGMHTSSRSFFES